MYSNRRWDTRTNRFHGDLYLKSLSYVSKASFLDSAAVKQSYALLVGLTWREETQTLLPESPLAKKLTVYCHGNLQFILGTEKQQWTSFNCESWWDTFISLVFLNTK
jgi:hypothetical protein